MNKDSINIVNLIGIMLIVVAIVSAGGLYYTASTYANISETFVSCEVFISGVNITSHNSTGEITFTTSVIIDNNSTLDIEIYRIEYTAQASNSPTTVTQYDKYIGGGSIGGRNGTVTADTIREVLVSFSINPDTTYMDRYEHALVDGGLYTYITGYVWYKISDFPEATKKLGIFYSNKVMVYEIQ
ncbi:MAG: hypothetical protein KAX31_00010 [Thermoplasmata archaeon]|nr:hypothetical protein [Thermoplasmata archaeon]